MELFFIYNKHKCLKEIKETRIVIVLNAQISNIFDKHTFISIKEKLPTRLKPFVKILKLLTLCKQNRNAPKNITPLDNNVKTGSS